MSLKEIIERFTLVSGLEMQEVSRWLPIILDCKEFFEEHLRGELSEADSRRAAYACAVYAHYKISLICGSEEVASFKVGDVQFAPLPQADVAEKMWLSERGSIGDILDICGEFAFRSVSI